MRYLTVSQDGSRLMLVIPDQLPLRSAANAIRGCRPEGASGGSRAYSYPAEPDVAHLVMESFQPQVGAEHARAVLDLLARHAAVAQAVECKSQNQPLQVDPSLRTDPMRHQVQALNFCAARFTAGAPGSALLMEQGTGKSLVAVGLANWLHAQGKIAWVLVLAPNSLKGTWGADDGEITLHSKQSPRIRILRGTRDQRQDYLARALQQQATDNHGLLWAVTNYDQLAVKLIGRGSESNALRFRALRSICRQLPGLLILDESSACKNWKALRTQAVLQLRDVFPFRLILTGTPVEASPLDVWPQFEVLQPGCLGYNSALAFERAHANYERLSIMVGKVRRIVQVVSRDSYRNLDDLERRVSQVSFRARAEECLDLPPVVVQKLTAELSPEQARLLRELRDQKMARVSDGVFLDGRNVLTRYQKMQQVVGGWAKAMDADGKDLGWVKVGDAKMKALQEYLELTLQDPKRKVVVFAEHPETEVRAVASMAAEQGWGAVEFTGQVDEAERDVRRQQFCSREPGSPRIMAAQWECAARGLNLTVADTIVFLVPTWRYGTWAQARKRVHRKGQEAPHVTEVYVLGVAPQKRTGKLVNTMDHVCLEALQSKQDVADIVTGDRAARAMEAL